LQGGPAPEASATGRPPEASSSGGRSPGGRRAEGGSSGGRRLVLHVDMDCFYAAVEAKECPAVRGLPVVVGGTGNRAVVASSSYEARAYGVHSAMPMAQARRVCPQLVVVAPRFDLYRGYSDRLHQIFAAFTPLIEGIGLDEAFLDVSGGEALFGSALEIASQLRERVGRELGLACSVGAGPSKLVAKLASKAAKPKASAAGAVPGRGIVVVPEEEVLGFIWPMAVESLWGVGPATGVKLRKLGVATVGDLAALPAEALQAALGKAAGQVAYDLAWGRDPRPVVADRAPKSIGHEETYSLDIVDRRELERRLVLMSDAVAGRAREQGFVARTVTVKLRYGDFRTLTRSHTFSSPQASGPALWTAGKALLDGLELGKGVRLLGISASGLLPVDCSPGEQLQLGLGTGGAERPQEGPRKSGNAWSGGPGQPGQGWARASKAVDAVRARFGEGAVRPAVAIGPLTKTTSPPLLQAGQVDGLQGDSTVGGH